MSGVAPPRQELPRRSTASAAAVLLVVAATSTLVAATGGPDPAGRAQTSAGPAAPRFHAGPDGGPGEDGEDARRAAVVAFVESETPVPSLTVYRDDAVEFPLFAAPEAQHLVFYRVREGGLYREGESGPVVRVVLGAPAEWTVFLDRSNGMIYRMSGFESGSDFNVLLRRFVHDVDRSHATALATGFVDLVHGGRAVRVEDFYEVRRAVENALHAGGMSDADITRQGRPWLEEWREAIAEILEPPAIASSDEGFRARRMVVRVARGGRNPVIEIRHLELAVTSAGDVAVVSDEIVAVFPSRADSPED